MGFMDANMIPSVLIDYYYYTTQFFTNLDYSTQCCYFVIYLISKICNYD